MQPLTASERLVRLRRWVLLHRRWLSATLAFLAVLVGLSAVAPQPTDEQTDQGTAAGAKPLAEGLLEVPVRLSDPDVAGLLASGDTVDVIGTDTRGPTTVVARELSVVTVPEPGDTSTFSSDEQGLIVVAATPSDALELADAAARGPVTVAVHP